MPRLGMVGRLGVFTVILVALCTSSVAFVYQGRERHRARMQWRRETERIGRLITGEGGGEQLGGRWQSDLARMLFRELRAQGAVYLVVRDSKLKPLMSFPRGAVAVPEPVSLPTRTAARTLRDRDRGGAVLDIVAPVGTAALGDVGAPKDSVDGSRIGFVQLGVREKMGKEALLSVLVGIWSLPLLVTILSGILASVGTKRVRKRLEALVTAVAKRSAGDLSGRIDESGTDEIAAFARALNGLVDRLIETETAARDARWTLEEKAHERTRRLERALEQALDQVRAAEETARSSGYMVLSVAHEVRWRASGVVQLLEALVENGEPIGGTRPIRQAIDTTQRLLRVAGDCLSMSDGRGVSPRVASADFDIVAVTEDVAESYGNAARQKRLDFVSISDPSVPRGVKGDATRWRHLVSNLLSNAIDSTENGNIVLRLASTALEAERIAIRLEVDGSGIGGRAGARQEGDNALNRGESPGSGTGDDGVRLAIVKQFVADMGGKVGFSGRSGEGFHVWVELPLELPEHSDRWSETSEFRTTGKALLVVRNYEARANLARHLEIWGLDVVSARTLEAIPELVSEHGGAGVLQVALIDSGLLREADNAQQYLRASWFVGERRLVVLGSLDGAVPVGLEPGEVQSIPEPVGVVRLRQELGALIAPKSSLAPGVEEDGQGEASPLLDGEQEILEVKTEVQPNTGPRRILLVDGDRTMMETTLRMLEDVGCVVDVAWDGRQAVEAFLRNRYDMVLMDCLLPGMNGFEASRAMRRVEAVQHTGNPTPIVAMITGTSPDERRACSRAGMTDVLAKPFAEEALYAALDRWQVFDSDFHSGSGEEEEALFPEREAVASTGFPDAAGEAEGSGLEEGVAIKRKALARLKALQRPGKPDIVTTVVSYYLEDASAMVSALEQAVEASNPDDVYGVAHRLKSGSANVGATRLATLCRRLESMGRNGDVVEMGEVVTEIKQEFGRVELALADCVTGHDGGV